MAVFLATRLVRVVHDRPADDALRDVMKEDGLRRLFVISSPRVANSQIDAHYPSDAMIRVVLDNHSAHISRETMAYLGERPGRFEYVHTPKHGSWLHLIEWHLTRLSVLEWSEKLVFSLAHADLSRCFINR